VEQITALINSGKYVPDALWESFGLSPEGLKDLKVVESSVYLTRECNLKCQYCKIIKTEFEKELSTEEWLKAFDVLEGLGIRFVNIAGGEPTVLPDLPKMLRYLKEKTTMEFSIVSNSMFGDAKAKELVDSGLSAYVASVDVLGGDRSLDDLRKSSAGIKMLEKLKNLGVKYLCANIVISAVNIDKVMEVTKHLSDRGVWVNICPIIWGKGDKWDQIEAADLSYRLTEEHRQKLQAISRELIDIKRSGALILPTEEYIAGIPENGITLGWKCYSDAVPAPPPRLTIDADGALMTCINMRGSIAEKYNIFALKDPAVYARFMDDWWKGAKNCTGCYWSTMVMARERQRLLEGLKQKVG
jgi:MoaA/NifB/PqqE/SkfB family radical SAM enzyme